MNRNRYRLVFNKLRGLPMAVAETATSQGKHPSDSQPSKTSPDCHFGLLTLTRRGSACLLLGVAVLQAMPLQALAQIAVDRNAPKSQQPTVLNASNGVPQINIQTPNGNGVSRNTYTQFDVLQNGVILNNSRTDTQTQLGGWVQGNPWLAAGTARVILNEVNSNNPSLLKGYIEVAGDRAQVVIANPSGISCDGCGFVNANRATLTTGMPVFGGGGSLDAYRVQGGIISIDGAGMDASRADYTDIIARAVQINAGVWANNLKVTAGTNQISADHTNTTPTAGTGTAPTFAIDVAALGGMYAGKIMLVGTEAGVGVRNAGQIGAPAGEVTVTAEGKLINTGTISTGPQTLTLTTQGLDNTGTLSSQSDISLTSRSNVANGGLINASRELKLDVTGNVTNSGMIVGQRLDLAADDLDNSGTLSETGNQGLALTAQTITNQTGATLGRLSQDLSSTNSNSAGSSGTTPSGGSTSTIPSTAIDGGSITSTPAIPVVLADGRITIRGDVINSGTLTGNGRVDLTATSLDNRGTVNADSLSVVGRRFANVGGAVYLSDLSAHVAGIDNSAGKLIVANRMDLFTQDLSNAGGSLQYAGSNDLSLAIAGALDNSGGSLIVNGGLHIQTATLRNNSGTLQSGAGMSIDTTGAIGNVGGTLQAANGLQIIADSLDNTAGVLRTPGAENLDIALNGTLINRGGFIGGAGIVGIGAGAVDNSAGTIYGQSGLTVNSNGILRNTDGAIASPGAVTIQSETLNNDRGNLQSGDALTVTSRDVISSVKGTLQSLRSLSVTAKGLDNSGGTLQTLSTEAITLTVSDALRNADGGAIAGNGAVGIQATTLDNSHGSLYAGAVLDIHTQAELINDGGAMQSGSAMHLESGTAVSNQAGAIQSSSDFRLKANTLNNSGGIVAALGDSVLTLDDTLINRNDGFIGSRGSVVIRAASIDNSAGSISTSSWLSLSSDTLLSNGGGLVQSGGDSRITVGSLLDNQSGRIETTGGSASMILDGGSLYNVAGRIAAAGTGDATFSFSGYANNNLGSIGSNGSLSLAGSGIGNSQGTLRATGNLTLTAEAGTANNTGGTLAAGNILSLTTLQQFTHRAGDILQGNGGINLSSSDGLLVDTGAALESVGTMSLRAANLLENRGRIISNDTVTLTTGDLINTSTGVIQSGGDLTVNIARQATNDGTLASQNNLALTANSMTIGAAGSLKAVGNLNLSLGSTLVQQGILSANNLTLTANSLDNRGLVAAMNDLRVQVADQLTNRSGRLIYAGRDQTLYAKQLLNEEDANLWAGRNLLIQGNASGDRALSVTNDKGQIEAQNDLTIRAATLTNQGQAPTLLTRSFNDSVAYIDRCGAYCYTTGEVDAYGTPVYYSPWGFRTATQAEVDAYWARNPNAPDMTPYGSFKTMPREVAGDIHALEGGWVAAVSGTEQYADSSASTKAAKLLAGGNFTFDGGSLTNVVSQIAASNNVVINGDSLTNQGQTLQRTATYTATAIVLSGGRHMPVESIPSLTLTENIGAVPASITAGGSITGTLSSSIINDASARPALNSRSAQNAIATIHADTSAVAATQAGAVPNGTPSPTPTAPALAPISTAAPARLSNGLKIVGGRLDAHDLALPANSYGLFTKAPPSAGYLIESNPAFTDHRTWLSSDYMLAALSLDPALTQKRLGDGFYEQQLVRDELFALTGRRNLNGASADAAQFQALMDAGLAAGRAFSLRPGMDLTATQVANLTSDIVWLVEREVGGQKVLVPQVYLSALHAQDLTPDGALLAARDITLSSGNTFSNSGRVSASNTLTLTATDLTNSGILETTAADGSTQLVARRDLINSGGTIAGGNVLAVAGRDVINRADQFDATAQVKAALKAINIDVGNAAVTEVGTAGRILAGQTATLQAGRDLRFQGGQLVTGGDAQLTAGNNLTLGTLDKTSQIAFTGKGGQGEFASVEQKGSELQAGGNVTLSANNDLAVIGSGAQAGKALTAVAGGALTVDAGQDMRRTSVQLADGDGGSTGNAEQTTVKGSSLAAGTDLSVAAGLNRQADLTIKASSLVSNNGTANLGASGNITIGTEQQQSKQETHTWGESSGFLSDSSHDVKQGSESTESVGSLVSANRVNVVTAQNIAVSGSNIVGTQDVTMTAGKALSIEAAKNTYKTRLESTKEESGLFSGGGIGVTWGNRDQTQTQDGEGVSHTGSTVGSVQGSVTLKAGEAYSQMGSSVTAPGGDVFITAQKVDIGAVYDTTQEKQTTEFSQSGLSLTVSSPVLSAIQSVRQMDKAKSQTKDPRMKALATANQAFAAKGAADAVQAGQGDANGQVATGQTGADGKQIMRDGNAADKVGGAKIMLTIGSSSSQSESTQTSSMAQGSTVAAGKNLTISATDGDLNAIGSTLNAGNDAALSATGNINLRAAENTNTLKSTQSNDSGYIGIGFGYGKQNGFTLEMGFGTGQGWDKGNDKAYTFTTVTAGNKASLTSGKDANLIGASVSGREVLASIGGNLNIETPQMVSNYASDASSAGFAGSLCTIYCTGQTFVGSANGSMSKVNSQYQSAVAMAGIQAGDGGFQVKVSGNTDLKGSVIASTEKAVQDGKNSFSTGGTLTLSNLDNKAEYSANSASGSVGTNSGSAGFGSDSGQASSTTLAGISGIAGNTKVRTGDGANGIAKIFDVTAVKNEINAQTQITQAFGQTATKAIGDYAATKMQEAQSLRDQAAKEPDSQRAAELKAQAQTLESQWGPEGTLRIAAHAVVGGLTGGANGALGAAAGTITAPLVNDALAKAGITGPLASALTGLASTATGVAAGGTAGGVTAFNEVANNYLSHQENDERFKAKQACNGGNGDAAACSRAAELDALDKQRDTEFHAACDGALSSSAGCAGETEKMYKNLATYAASDARDTASKTQGSDLTTAHRDEMQSYLDLIKTANADVKTSSETTVSSPDSYKADPYGVVKPNNTRDAYLVMKFGTEALAIGNVNNGGDYSIMTSWWARNGMNNEPGYATGLMLAHVDAAAVTKLDETNKAQGTNAPYIPVDRYTLSYAPTTGFTSDVWGAFLTKIGIESESVQGLRSQMEAIQAGSQPVNWVVHSRGGAEFVQAASGSSVDKLYNNSVVFHAGANNSIVTDFVMSKKSIGDVINKDNRYRDNSNDLVPQIIGLRALTSPLNFLTSLFSAPCLSSTFCTIQQSPHTLPSNWNNLAPETK